MCLTGFVPSASRPRRRATRPPSRIRAVSSRRRRDRRRGALDDDRLADDDPHARAARQPRARPQDAGRADDRDGDERRARSSSASRAAPRCQARSAGRARFPGGRSRRRAPRSSASRGGGDRADVAAAALDRDPAERVEDPSDDGRFRQSSRFARKRSGRSIAAPRKNGSESESWFATTITGPGGQRSRAPSTSSRQTRADAGAPRTARTSAVEAQRARAAADRRARSPPRAARIPRACRARRRPRGARLALDERAPTRRGGRSGCRTRASSSTRVEAVARRARPGRSSPTPGSVAARRCAIASSTSSRNSASDPVGIVRAEADHDDRRERRLQRAQLVDPLRRRPPDAVVRVDPPARELVGEVRARCRR